MLLVESIDSQHLSGNLHGDPSQRDLVVYLPPSYGTSTRRYPVLYLLHGYGGQAINWTKTNRLADGYIQPIDEVFDPAITKHHAAEMIIVGPDGKAKWGCGQWVDSPVNGNYEQYVAQEVVSYVDHHFRTIPDRNSRGVFGISSGGFGAWHLGSRNPDVFGAMALQNADSYFEYTHKPWFYQFYDSIFPEQPNGPIEGVRLSRLCYGLSACYTPNPTQPPFYVDLPIDYPSGEVIQPLWEQWLSYDPVVSWRNRVDNLRQLRGILLDVGYNDEYGLHYGHRLLSRGLTSVGITHQVEEHDGCHDARLFERFQLALRWFSDVLNLQG